MSTPKKLLRYALIIAIPLLMLVGIGLLVIDLTSSTQQQTTQVADEGVSVSNTYVYGNTRGTATVRNTGTNVPRNTPTPVARTTPKPSTGTSSTTTTTGARTTRSTTSPINTGKYNYACGTVGQEVKQGQSCCGGLINRSGKCMQGCSAGYSNDSNGVCRPDAKVTVRNTNVPRTTPTQRPRSSTVTTSTTGNNPRTTTTPRPVNTNPRPTVRTSPPPVVRNAPLPTSTAARSTNVVSGPKQDMVRSSCASLRCQLDKPTRLSGHCVVCREINIPYCGYVTVYQVVSDLQCN